MTLNAGNNTLSGTISTASYSLGVSTTPVEATVSATIDGTPTTVTEGSFSVPTTAQTIVITVEAEGYTTGTYTFTNAVETRNEHVSADGNWLMLTDAQLQESYAINYEVLTDGSTFIPYNYQAPIAISGTVGSNTTIKPTSMMFWEEPGYSARVALTVGIKRHTAEGYMYYPVCTLNDGSTYATTGQKTQRDSSGVPPTSITIGNDVYDIFCFVCDDKAYRFGKVELMKLSTEPDSVATVEATLTVDNSEASYWGAEYLDIELSSSTTGVDVVNTGATKKIRVTSSWQSDDIVIHIENNIQGATFTAVAVDYSDQDVPLTVTGKSFTILANDLSSYQKIVVLGNAASYSETRVTYVIFTS